MAFHGGTMWPLFLHTKVILCSFVSFIILKQTSVSRLFWILWASIIDYPTWGGCYGNPWAVAKSETKRQWSGALVRVTGIWSGTQFYRTGILSREVIRFQYECCKILLGDSFHFLRPNETIANVFYFPTAKYYLSVKILGGGNDCFNSIFLSFASFK